jgi:ketosteroid isomerase-like protein
LGRGQAVSETTARNIEIVRRVCDCFTRRDPDTIESLLDETCQWNVVGRRDRAPFGGAWSKAEMVGLSREFFGAFDSFQFDIQRIIAEGDCVFVEATSQGRGPGRKVYNNVYLMRFLLNDEGKLVDVKEHFDPLEVLAYMEAEA